jgi:hypothetical protein
MDCLDIDVSYILVFLLRANPGDVISDLLDFHHHYRRVEMNPGEGLSFQTPGFAHYSLAWSPFYDGRLAVASAANFGLVGNGRLHLTSVRNGSIALDKQYLLIQLVLSS